MSDAVSVAVWAVRVAGIACLIVAAQRVPGVRQPDGRRRRLCAVRGHRQCFRERQEGVMEEWMWAVALVTVMAVSVIDSWMARRRVKYLSKRRFLLEVRLDELEGAARDVDDAYTAWASSDDRATHRGMGEAVSKLSGIVARPL